MSINCIPKHCALCPRRCGADRTGQVGICGAGSVLKAARAALHYWEEPCISGTRGSGTIFFSGCSLQCCYCQNYRISADGLGKEISVSRLTEIFLNLQAQGAHNINLVTPTQWLPWILPALHTARKQGLSIPIVYNTGGYENVETVQALQGTVDIWLADVKYVSPALSDKLSAAPDYFSVCQNAVRAMLLQVPRQIYNSEGILQKGVILRHLALPGHIDDSFAVLDWIASLPTESYILSLMSQFTPFYKSKEHGLGRRITSYEYRRVVDHALALGLYSGFVQSKSSAKEEYTPLFDLEGI